MYSRLMKSKGLKFLALTLILCPMMGCASSGRSRSRIYIAIPGFGVYSNDTVVTWGPAVPLPSGAAYLGTVTIHGRTMPVYFDPATGKMYFRDADGDAHEVDFSKLPPEVVDELERMRRQWERENEERDPVEPSDTAPDDRELPPLPPWSERYISQGALTPQILVLPDGTDDPAASQDPTELIDVDIEFEFDTDEDTARVALTVPDTIAWAHDKVPDTSAFDVRASILDNGDGTVTLSARGSINGVLAVLMMAGLEKIEGEIDTALGFSAAVRIELYQDVSMVFVNVAGMEEETFFIHPDA